MTSLAVHVCQYERRKIGERVGLESIIIPIWLKLEAYSARWAMVMSVNNKSACVCM